jgi:hypothetical protein
MKKLLLFTAALLALACSKEDEIIPLDNLNIYDFVGEWELVQFTQNGVDITQQEKGRLNFKLDENLMFYWFFPEFQRWMPLICGSTDCGIKLQLSDLDGTQVVDITCTYYEPEPVISFTSYSKNELKFIHTYNFDDHKLDEIKIWHRIR